MAPIAEAIALAAPSFTGQSLRPTDPGDDDRRRVHNGLNDKRPAAIASCHGVADIVEAVHLALGLEVSVRGGGHNGRATIDRGLMIDLAPIKGIHVDVPARTVRAQGGVLWRALNRETQLVDLADDAPSPSETERGIRWARQTFASLAPYLAPTRYVNYLEDDAADPAAVAYGPNLPRLRAIKTKYDPGNFFKHNVNIPPN